MSLHTENFEIGLHAPEQDGTQRGWFEHNEHGDEYGGGLWFKGSELVDYDGIGGYLPKEVLDALEATGFDVDEMRPTLEDNEMIIPSMNQQKMRLADEKAEARAKLACDELIAIGVDARWLLGAVAHRNLFFVIRTENREINASTKSVLRKYRLDHEFYDDTAIAKVYGY